MNFAENGVILTFGRCEAEVSCFDMQWFFCFEHEKEVLFFGGDSLLKICNIQKYERSAWHSFTREIKALQAIHSFVIGYPLPIAMSMKTKDVMLSMLRAVLSRSLDETFMSPCIKSLLLYQLFRAPNNIVLDWSILMEDYGFFSGILMKTSPHKMHILNILNLSILFPMSQLLTVIMPKECIPNDEFLSSIVHDVASLAKRGCFIVEMQWLEPRQWLTSVKLQDRFVSPNVVVTNTPEHLLFSRPTLNRGRRVRQKQKR